MALLDLFARSSTIALLATMVLVLAPNLRRVPSAAAGIAFFFTIAAHLVLTSPDHAGVRALDLILFPAALVVPGTFWLFSRALFEEEGGLTWRDAAICAVLLTTGFLRSGPAAGVGTVLYYASSLGLVAVALARVIRGFPSDLVEPRRRLRAVLTVAVGLEILMVISGEILLGGERPPRWVDTLKGSGAFGLTLLFTVWSLTPRRELFAAERVAGSAVGTVTAVAETSGEDARFRDLLELMRRDRAYRQEGLTIGLLARRLDIPEYRLRRIINQQLGYRNFNAFLNDFRVEDACQMLADPAQERLPILNLALDLGYGAPGPFNRAFRARMGQTPTDYRRTKLGSSSPTAGTPAQS
jgi:AraC-like DNA-binding protein